MNAHLQPTGSAYFIAKETESRRKPHAFGSRRQRAGRSRPRHRPVLRPRLQHREPDGLGDRASGASVAHHHRHPRHAACAGADQGAARAHRAGSPRRRPDGSRPRTRPGPADRARSGAGEGDRRRRDAAPRRCALPMPSMPRWSMRRSSHFILEITGKSSKIDQFIAIMKPLGLIEVCRTGIAAMNRGPQGM